MLRSDRATIDDLDAIGNELVEEHLRLAVGGVLKRTWFDLDCTGYANNHCGDMIYKVT